MSSRVRKWVEAAKVYLQPRMLVVGALGFASGLPFLLTGSTLSYWLVRAGVDLAAIGAFALVHLPYNFKVFWAPIVDRSRIPVLGRLLGRRRGWGVTVQLALAVAMLVLGASDPEENAAVTAGIAIVVAALSATQDIVIDAYRVELLDDEEQGAGAAVVVFGYRIGMLVAGAGALYMFAVTSWFVIYAVMAALLLGVGTTAFLLSRETSADEEVELEEGETTRFNLARWLRRAVYEPLAEFASRQGRPFWVGLVVLYKVGDALVGPMTMPLYDHVGFTETEIANVTKLFGLIATIGGSFLGGIVLARLGVLRGMLWCGVLQLVSNFGFAVLSMVGDDIGALTAVIALENVASGMGTAAFVALLSVLCNVRYTATQYALLSSLSSLGGRVLSAPSGWLVELTSWPVYFSLTAAAAVPGLLLVAYVLRREDIHSEIQHDK